MKFSLFTLMIICGFAVSCGSNNPKCKTGDCKNGYGEKIYPDGGYEKGQWKNGKLDGKGEQFFGTTSEFSGDTYIGEFKNGEYDGQGTYTDISEEVKYQGEWRNGVPVGENIKKIDLKNRTAVVSENDSIKWNIIENKKFNFEIKFPEIKGYPVIQKESIDENSVFGDVKKYSYDLNCQKSNHINIAYSITIGEIKQDSIKRFSKDEYRPFYDVIEYTIKTTTNFASIHRTVVEVNGHKGREIWFKNDNYKLRIICRTFLVNNIEYRLSVIVNEKDCFNPFIKDFLDSFQIKS